MPAFTVTTTPQIVFKSTGGTSDFPTSFGAQIKNGGTGTVTIARSEDACVVDEACYFTENTSITSVDLLAGQEVWMVAGSDTDIVFDTWGPA